MIIIGITKGKHRYHYFILKMNVIPIDQSGEKRIPSCEITENDVLCGRGGDIIFHPGNEKFRKIVEDKRLLYFAARYREKRMIAKSVVEEIRGLSPRGRFLAQIELPGRKRGRRKPLVLFWQEVGDSKAIEKAAQALRENAPMIKTQMKRCLPSARTVDGSNNESNRGLRSPSRNSNGDVCADEFDDSLFLDDEVEHVECPGGIPQKCTFSLKVENGRNFKKQRDA